MFTSTIAIAFLSSAIAVISGYLLGYWQGWTEAWREAADLMQEATREPIDNTRAIIARAEATP